MYKTWSRLVGIMLQISFIILFQISLKSLHYAQFYSFMLSLFPLIFYLFMLLLLSLLPKFYSFLLPQL